jgi:hypothetical protein|tara:strand:+ start:4181 stop:4750 length:570 start_codon:yes stop_codon:yes gene_type:complete
MDELHPTQQENYEDDQQRFEAEVQQWQRYEEEDKMLTKRDFLNELVQKNHLVVEEDIFTLSLGGKKTPIIARTGIEKIQYINNIRVTFKAEVLTSDFSVIKAIAIMDTKDDTMQVETYSSAKYGKRPEGNTTFNYIPEIAEKRALSRAVLKICGAYRYGVYGEDESDEFKKPGGYKGTSSSDLLTEKAA